MLVLTTLISQEAVRIHNAITTTRSTNVSQRDSEFLIHTSVHLIPGTFSHVLSVERQLWVLYGNVSEDTFQTTKLQGLKF